jgi:hypothetical protein
VPKGPTCTANQTVCVQTCCAANEFCSKETDASGTLVGKCVTEPSCAANQTVCVQTCCTANEICFKATDAAGTLVGRCVAGCPSGQIACGGACVDPVSDVRNCGGCGRACDPGQPCTRGECRCASNEQCRAGYICCRTVCVDPRSDPSNCGFCGNQCPAGCHGGGCRGCQSNAECSGGQVCGARQNSENSCHPCDSDLECQLGSSSGLVCVQGRCTCTDSSQCPVGQLCLNGTCNRCTSNAQCPPGKICYAGQCAPSGCPDGQFYCYGGCADLNTEASNCGGCGIQCAGGKRCASGECV